MGVRMSYEGEREKERERCNSLGQPDILLPRECNLVNMAVEDEL